MWFVVHVKPGTEKQAVNLLQNTPKSDVLQEVFSPMAENMRRTGDDLLPIAEPMLEGCVFVVAPSRWELRACLRKSEALEGLLTRHPSFSELQDDEAQFINELTEPTNRTVPVSKGIMGGKASRMQIRQGPLVGREDDICKYTHRRHWAYLNVTVAGEPMKAKVGLWVTRDGK